MTKYTEEHRRRLTDYRIDAATKEEWAVRDLSGIRPDAEDFK